MMDLGRFRTMALRTLRSAIALASAVGVIFALTILASPTAQAQNYRLYPPDADGIEPQAGVTIRGDYVYGTAAMSGSGGGEVFEVKHLGRLTEFDRGIYGPEARVVFGPDGPLYTTYPGYLNDSFGAVVKLFPSPTISGLFWRSKALYHFKGYPDGSHPGHGDLIWDQQGNIYGTTINGGTGKYGVVYELMPPVPPSNTWTESVIWNFTGPDGEYPQNGVIFDPNGDLFGTARWGGQYGFGTVFKLTPSGNTWTETNAYDFQGGADGRYPIAGLMLDSSGNIYGATSDGGSGHGGTIFELIPSGNTYTFKLLYSFSGPLGQNCGPWGTLTMDATGNVYGTTYCNGLYHAGTVFKLTNTQNGWVYTSLHDFPAVDNDGVYPMSNVSFDANGNLWGTASAGYFGSGVVWEITP